MSAPTDNTFAEYDVEPTVPGPAPIPEQTERPRDARWGFLADGRTPRRKPGRPAKGTAPKSPTARARSRRAGPAPSGKPTAPKPPTAPKTRDYSEPLQFLIAAAVMPLSLLFPLDALAITMQAPDLLKVGNQMANDIPSLGKWLAEAEKWTPYAAGLSMAARLGAQIAHNHGLLPEQAAVMLGGIPRTQLAAMLVQQKRQAAADKAAEEQAFQAAMADAMAQDAA